MAVSTIVGTKRDGQITLKDSAAHNLILTLEVGDFSFEEPKADRTVIRDRGVISGLRKGDDPVGSCSFTVHFTEFTNSTADNLMDFVYKRGPAAGYTSTGGTGFEQSLVDVEFKVDKTALGDSAAAVVTLGKVLLFASFSEADPDSLSITGEVYGSYAYTGIS